MKIAELVEALEAVRAITGECEVLVEGSTGEIDAITQVEVCGSPGSLSCKIDVVKKVS